MGKKYLAGRELIFSVTSNECIIIERYRSVDEAEAKNDLMERGLSFLRGGEIISVPMPVYSGYVLFLFLCLNANDILCVKFNKYCRCSIKNAVYTLQVKNTTEL